MSLLLAMEQIAPVRGAVEENTARIRERAGAATGDGVVLFPELCLTGYALGHRTPELARPAVGFSLGLPGGGPTVVVGMVERGRDELVYNTAVALRGDTVLARHRKIYLPTYGTFEEGRHFARGRQAPATFRLPGEWTAGLLICEDLWHPALAYLLAVEGVDLILVLAAAVGRGRPGPPTSDEESPAPPAEPGRASDDHASLFASMARWELLARTTALHNGVYVALANRVGVEDGLTFGGGSMVVDPAGEVIARAPQDREARLEVTLERGEIRRARHPFSHLRDEDPALVRDALDRILRERDG